MRPPGPQRSVRLRLTVVYGGLFLACGAGLLAITYLLVSRATGITAVTASSPNGPPTGAVSHTHSVDLHQLLVQSGIALAIMTVASAVLGWIVAGRVLAPQHAAFEAQRRFVANASHELRTPLAMMRTSLDVAVAKPPPIAPEVHALDVKLREGLDQADRLVESFLALARAEHGLLDERAPVSLTALVDGALESRGIAIAEKRIDVETSLAPVTVDGSATLIARMVDNVIENAVRHNEPGGFITAASEVRGDVARLVVENGGRRVDDASVEQLGRPFRRLGIDRTGATGGVGLGLSIVAAVAGAHGGALELRARPEGGLRVEIELAGATLAWEPAGVGS
jgi:signal transduction histidine kinase